jgi:hypothetical protein
MWWFGRAGTLIDTPRRPGRLSGRTEIVLRIKERIIAGQVTCANNGVANAVDKIKAAPNKLKVVIGLPLPVTQAGFPISTHRTLAWHNMRKQIHIAVYGKPHHEGGAFDLFQLISLKSIRLAEIKFSHNYRGCSMSKAPKSLASKVDAIEARVRAIESELSFLRGFNARLEHAAMREASTPRIAASWFRWPRLQRCAAGPRRRSSTGATTARSASPMLTASGRST